MAVKHFAQISRDNSKNVSGNCVHFLAIYYDPSRLLIWTFIKSNLVPLVVFFLSGLLRGEELFIACIVESSFTY